MAFWSLRIFIQKQGLKKLYRESAAETWAPAPGHSPRNRQSPLFGLPPDKPSQSIPVKRVSVEAAESAGDEEKLGPSHPSLSSSSHWGSRPKAQRDGGHEQPPTSGH